MNRDKLPSSSDDNFEQGFLSTLLQDVAASIQRHNADDTPAARRNLIRTLHTAIEGFGWAYREHVKDSARSVSAITQEEELALSDVIYQVADNGKISSQPRYLSITATIRLATRLATRLSPKFEVRFDTGEWEKFRLAIAIRNRVTHPKRAADLLIGDQDISTCLSGFFWLLDISTTAMEAANAAVASHTREFRELLEGLRSGDPSILTEYENVIASSNN